MDTSPNTDTSPDTTPPESPRWTRSAPFLEASLLVVLAVTFLDVVPAELGVPVTLLLIWPLLHLGGERFRDLGLKFQMSWSNILLLGTSLAVLKQALGIWGIIPLLKAAEITLPDMSNFEEIRGDLPTLALFLFVSWVPAGFGEEVIWRGFVMSRLARLLGDGRPAWIAGLLLSSIAFGLLHSYQGTSGMVLTGFAGLMYGSIYLWSGRNLWLVIFTHGMSNTLGFLIMYFGFVDDLLG